MKFVLGETRQGRRGEKCWRFEPYVLSSDGQESGLNNNESGIETRERKVCKRTTSTAKMEALSFHR